MENFKGFALDAKGTSSKGLANVLCSILCVMCRHVNPTSTLLATQPTIRTAMVTLKPITQPVKRQGNRAVSTLQEHWIARFTRNRLFEGLGIRMV